MLIYTGIQYLDNSVSFDVSNLALIDRKMAGMLDKHFEEDLEACEQVEKARRE